MLEPIAPARGHKAVEAAAIRTCKYLRKEAHGCYGFTFNRGKMPSTGKSGTCTHHRRRGNDAQ